MQMRSRRKKPELVAEEVIKKNEDLAGFTVAIIPPKGLWCNNKTY